MLYPCCLVYYKKGNWMKLYHRLVLVMCFQLYAQSPIVVLMVKNEALVIKQTLEPFVLGGVTEYIIFDTGSTDGTQEVVTDFFDHYKNAGHVLTTYVIEEPFIDFATSRNHALDQAERLFPDARFMIMPDAEWYIHNAQGLIEFCTQEEDEPHASYLVYAQSTAQSFYVTRLIRCRTNTRFVGVAHEALNKISTGRVPKEVYFEWRPSQKGAEKSAQRWKRDRDLLLKDHEQNPHNERTLFYLGQTYDCLGDWENAYLYYQKRAAIRGWDEENFVTCVRMGDVARHLAEKDNLFCQAAVEHYLQAYAMRPHRAEPLIKIAEYYLEKGQMPLAFLFARRAVDLPYPDSDILFVEKYLYDFARYDILGICAWYVGEYEVGEWAVLQALEVKPDAQHLQRNLQFYADRRLK